MNTDILVVVGGLMLLVLMGAAFYLLTVFDKPRKMQKDRLDRVKARHTGGGTLSADGTKSNIRKGGNQTGLDVLMSGLLPKPEQFQARLDKTGRKISIGQYFGTCGIIALVVFGAIYLAMGEVLFALVLGLALGLGLPHIVIGKMGNNRIEKFITQFPEAIDLMVRGLKAGLPINETIISVGQEIPAPTGKEFQQIADEVRFGKTLEEALWDTAARLATQDFKFFVITLVVQRETGGNLAETLGNLSTILRQRQAMKLKVRALSSEARASAMILGALPFVMLGAILTMNYDYGIILFTDPQAQMIGLGGLVWMGIGVFIMAQMINFEF